MNTLGAHWDYLFERSPYTTVDEYNTEVFPVPHRLHGI